MTNITSAIKTLSKLLQALEDAYWDSCEITAKDRVFDLVTCVHAELNELAKLSVSDLDMPYETITPELSGCCDKLRRIMNDIEEHFPRAKTIAALKEAVPSAAELITECRL